MRRGRYMCERETGDDGGGACTGSRAGNWAITLQELQPSSRVKGSSVGRTDNTNDKRNITWFATIEFIFNSFEPIGHVLS